MTDIVQRNIVETTFRVIDNTHIPLRRIGQNLALTRTALRAGMFLFGGYAMARATRNLVHAAMETSTFAEESRVAITSVLTAYTRLGEQASQIQQGLVRAPLDFAQQLDRQFAHGMQMAQRAIDIIQLDAARLPGTAEEYVQVFRTALPGALGAGMRNLRDIARMTDMFMALASTRQIDALTAGQNLLRMLQGHVTTQMRMWRDFEPMLGMTPGMMNRLNAQERVAAVLRTLAAYAPTLERLGHTWEAVSGTFQTWRRILLRDAFAPVFEHAKNVLHTINYWLEKNQETITAVGIAISHHIVRGLERAERAVLRFGRAFAHVGSVTAAQGVRAGFLAAFPGMRGHGAEGRQVLRTWLSGHLSPDVTGMGWLSGIARLGVTLPHLPVVFQSLLSHGGLLVGAFIAMAKHTGVVKQLFDSLVMVGRVLLVGFTQFSAAMDIVDNLLGDALAVALPALGQALTSLAMVLIPMVAQAMVVAAQVAATVLRPALEGVAVIARFLSRHVFGLLTLVALRYAAVTLMTVVPAVLTFAGALRTSIIPGVLLFARVLTVQGITALVVFTRNMLLVAVSALPTLFAALMAGSAWVQLTLSEIMALQGGVAGLVLAFALLGVATTFLVDKFLRAIGMFDANGSWWDDAKYLFGEVTGEHGATTGALGDLQTALGNARRSVAGLFGAADMPKAANVQGEEEITPENARRIAIGKRDQHGQRGGTYNDFRYSRFDITQRFAEGFDPDRIAVAFSSDLERAAASRLQSGYAPLTALH